LNPYDYDRNELLNLLPKIRPYTQDVETGLLTVVKALFRIGVTVIYQPYLKAIQVRGATMVINGKPCIVLTDYLNRYTTLWHTLIHELHHVLYDLEEIEKRDFHLSGQPDLFLINENKADEFARQYLFSVERSRQIFPFINDDVIVKKFTDSAQVHSSFAYAYYLFDLTQKGYSNAWGSKLAKKIPVCQASLTLLNTRAFERDTLKESIDYLRRVIFNV
jgi:Zn-dependent peptidase ImmA (M78 family)